MVMGVVQRVGLNTAGNVSPRLIFLQRVIAKAKLSQSVDFLLVPRPSTIRVRLHAIRERVSVCGTEASIIVCAGQAMFLVTL